MRKATIIGLSLGLAFALMATISLAFEPKLEPGFRIEFKAKYSLPATLNLTVEPDLNNGRIL